MNVGTADLAAILSLTDRQVQNLHGQGILTKDGRGSWPLAPNVQAYIRHKVDAEAQRADRGTGDSRMRALKADDLAIRIETRSRKLVQQAKAEALAICDHHAASLRVDLQGLPARLTNDVAFRRKIEDGIDAAFRAASQRAEAEALLAEEAFRSLAAAPEDDTGSVGVAEPDVPTQRRKARPKKH